jgi:hypothetical protein
MLLTEKVNPAFCTIFELTKENKVEYSGTVTASSPPSTLGSATG